MSETTKEQGRVARASGQRLDANPYTPTGSEPLTSSEYSDWYDWMAGWLEAGQSGTAPQKYTVTNATDDRTLNAQSTTLDKIANVVSTLLKDMGLKS